MIKNFLNPEGHQNPINGSKVTVILLKGLILPIGGASAGLRSKGLPFLVYSPLPIGFEEIIRRLQMLFNNPQCSHKEGQKYPII